MIYLDNAATSYPKPQCVIRELLKSFKEAPGNPGRSSHRYSVAAAEAIYECREKISELLSAPYTEGVVFTYNATHALNLAIKTYVENGTHVLTSDIEHNAVIRPLEKLRAEGKITYSTFSTDEDIEKSIEELLTNKTKCIISTLQSNVTGKSISLKKLSNVSKKHDLTLIIDASQSLGHANISLKSTPCDVLCGAGHKGLFGIQGVGFAVFSDTTRHKSFIEGGSGTDSINTEMPIYLPEGYEAGTLGTPAICALRGGINYVKSYGLNLIEEELSHLTEELNGALSSIHGIKVYSALNGIVSFNLKNIPSSVIAGLLDEKGICVRSGLHCAPSAHKKLGTLTLGTVRASLSIQNTKKEMDRVYKIIRNIANIY